MYEPDLYDPRQPHQLAVVGATPCFIQPQDASGVFDLSSVDVVAGA